MKVRFISSVPRTGYSGGRLLAIGMAESLAMTGADVEFLTNNKSIMFDEFKAISKIKVYFTNLNILDDYLVDDIDFLIIIPQQGKKELHQKWVEHGLKLKSKIILINFESANWYNEVSPFKRSESLWDGWIEVSKHCSAIASISEEGNKYAKEFYKSAPENCKFVSLYPGINNYKADAINEVLERKNQIVFLTRIDPHKGFDILEPLMTPELNGYTVLICIGNGKFPFFAKLKLKRRLKKYGIKLRIIYKITTERKFELLKESKLLYFPSKFEGFGLPPLEAAYCKTPCACTDLPVLKEFGQKAFKYGDSNSVEGMRKAVLNGINSHEEVNKEWKRIADIATLESWGKRQMELFKYI